MSEEVLFSTNSYRFGPFELRTLPVRLLRSGRPVDTRLQGLQVLQLLVSRAGEVVTRDEIRELLWGPECRVNIDRAINGVIFHLRRSLEDDAGESTYIETVPHRGYRFAAPVRVKTEPVLSRSTSPAAAREPSSRWGAWIFIGSSILLVMAFFLLLGP